MKVNVYLRVFIIKYFMDRIIGYEFLKSYLKSDVYKFMY